MKNSTEPVAIVALNLGGPDSEAAVEPFLRNLLGDPDVIQFGWLRPLQPLFARLVARRRAPYTTGLYRQIGRFSPIREESQAQAQAVVDRLAKQGISATPFVAMGAWHPFSKETVAEIKNAGLRRVLLLPLFPHRSRTTIGSAFRAFAKAAKGQGLDIAQVDGYATHPQYLQAVAETIAEAHTGLTPSQTQDLPVLFSAHGLPVRYIEKGDPYLDDIRATVDALANLLGLGSRVRLSFQSRLGKSRWLSPSTEEMLETLGREKHKALLMVPISFTGEHIETLYECDVLYRDLAAQQGIQTFLRARTVGCNPSFIAALADLSSKALKARGWTTLAA